MNDKEDTLKGMVYDLTTPVNSVLNRIKSFQDLCTILEKEKSNAQLVSIAYLIFTKLRAFMDVLKSWNAKAPDDKIFENLKTHMRTEHFALRQGGALSIGDSELSQANILQEFTAHQNKLAQEMNAQLSAAMQTNMQQTFNAFQLKDGNQESLPPPGSQTANNVTNDKLLALF